MAGRQDRLDVTSRVWLKVSKLQWVPGVVHLVNDATVTVQTEDGQLITIPRGAPSISQRTPTDLEDVDNLTLLPDLDEPNMLNSLNVRYLQKKIYTRTGPILVAMNPWTDLQMYGEQVLHSYRRKKIDNVPPHVYAIAEAAFANMQANKKDQTILVSGDSGSGKTESTKFMMQYLAAVARTAHTEQQVLQCNPVLEAFGNAKTLRNDNSSRFGKYIDIHFDETFALIGAKIETYLLEKSRVVGQESGERNFHIFYQLTSQSNVNQDLSRTLSLLPAEHFNYIKKGASVSVGHRAATSFQHTLEALEGIGISKKEQSDIFGVLALILHLGNLEFQADADSNALCSVHNKQAILCARLMGCRTEAFLESLLRRQIQAGSKYAEGESFVVCQTQQQAIDSLDALAKALYGSMFEILVRRINQALLEQKTSKIRTIAILDIFGFEHFKNNHFEQFCINYANEKLQGHFNEFNFSLEVIEYQREEIQWNFQDFYFETNTKCIELIEAKRHGMLAFLDEQCIMPNGNDESFCMKLTSELRDHPYFIASKMRGLTFTVKHYAADVTYDAAGFCFKNKDPVQPAIVDLVMSGSSDYLRSLFAEHHQKLSQNKEMTKTIIFESVTAQFKRQLSDLMTRIAAAQPHFVRCINPNSQKEPGKLEPEMILDQLRCSGLMEAVRVSRAGFPVRIPHDDFLFRFSLLTPRTFGDSKAAVLQMCAKLQISQENIRIGKTKVFMRREIHEKLEEDRSRLLVCQTLTVQKVFRGHRDRLFVRKVREELAERQKKLLFQQWEGEMDGGLNDHNSPFPLVNEENDNLFSKLDKFAHRQEEHTQPAEPVTAISAVKQQYRSLSFLWGEAASPAVQEAAKWKNDMFFGPVTTKTIEAVVDIILKLAIDYWAIENITKFGQDIRSHVASAALMNISDLRIQKIWEGSTVVKISIYGSVRRSALEIARELQQQAANANSPLRQGDYGSKISDLILVPAEKQSNFSFPGAIQRPSTEYVRREAFPALPNRESFGYSSRAFPDPSSSQHMYRRLADPFVPSDSVLHDGFTNQGNGTSFYGASTSPDHRRYQS